MHRMGLDGLLIECPLCGRYELIGQDVVVGRSQWTSELKLPLSCAARQASESGHPLGITKANVAEFAGPHTKSRIADNRERLLREVARKAGRPQMGASFSLTTDFTLIDCYSTEEFVWYIESLKSQQLVYQTGAGPTVAQLTLSVEGWRQVQPLPRPGGIPGRCFVAMWFDDSMRMKPSSSGFRGLSPTVDSLLRFELIGKNTTTRSPTRLWPRFATRSLSSPTSLARGVIGPECIMKRVSHGALGVLLFIVVGNQISATGTSTL